MIDAYFYQVELPYNVHEMVTPGYENDYTVYINSRLSPAMKKEAYRHALKHCCGEDFGKDDVNEIENRAHNNA